MHTDDLIEVFEDTQKCIKNDDSLRFATEKTCCGTKMYNEGFISEKAVVKSDCYNVIVKEGTSFKCAQEYAVDNNRIAVLNFANPINPGGGVAYGDSAQEETLCRCSNLFNSISAQKMKEDYYDYHNGDKNNYLFSDRIIYSPDVVVFKSDDTYEKLQTRFLVDVITCAAPYNVYKHDLELLKNVYLRRMTNIFEVAIENGVDILILGAFGCGVFQNPPNLIAESFKKLIEEKYYRFFNCICFPLLRSRINKNYNIFLQTFK